MVQLRKASGPSNILVTGGAGYIGAHTVKALAEGGYRPVVFDNLSSGFRKAARWGEFVHGDIRDYAAVEEALQTWRIGAVIHLAAVTDTARSIARPDLFYEVNVGGTGTLLRAMKACGVSRLVFSSTAAVYGAGAAAPFKENDPREPASPYADTKLACERMIAGYCKAFGISAIALRFFNAAGADASGLIGEAQSPETHLIPLALSAGLGGSPLTVFGDDFDTPDGTAIRDYVHVSDLAAAHVLALETALPAGSFEAVNLASGRAVSVFEVLDAVRRALGRPAPFTVGGRRLGDPAVQIADPSKAQSLLGWTAEHSTIDEIVASAAAWRRDPKYGAAEGISALLV
jgi:UDP-glucose 4-epimerase/UDP-arabinose 4-epimerase